jgi:hypothetical protein
MPDPEAAKMTGPERGQEQDGARRDDGFEKTTAAAESEPDWYENYLAAYAEALSAAAVNLNDGMKLRQYAAIALAWEHAKIRKCEVRSRWQVEEEIVNLITEKKT